MKHCWHFFQNWLASYGGGGSSNPDAVLLSIMNEEFTTNEESPITVARSAEPGPGSWQTSYPAEWKIEGNVAVPLTVTADNWKRSYLSSNSGITRTAGYAIYCKVKLALLGEGFQLYLHNNAYQPYGPTDAQVDGSLVLHDGGYIALFGPSQIPYSAIDIDFSKTYELALVLRETSGCIALIREYGTTQWKFLWYHETGVSATVYPAVSFYNPAVDGSNWCDNIKTIDTVASGVTEFSSRFGWCPNHSTFAGAGALSAYTPDIGPAWSGGGLSQFTVDGELQCASAAGIYNGHPVVCESGLSDCVIYVDNKDKLDGMGIVFRYTDDNNFLFAKNESNTNIGIWKREGGSPTQLATLAVTWYDDQRICVKLEGSSIKAWAWRATPVEATSSFNQTATKHGVLGALGVANTFDNYSVWPLDMTFPEVE